jgi:hypothetical protein
VIALGLLLVVVDLLQKVGIGPKSQEEHATRLRMKKGRRINLMNLQEFEQLLSPYKTIKENYVKTRLDFYKKGHNKKRYAAQASAVLILLFSLLIPIVVNFDFTGPWTWLSKTLIVSLMSLSIAFVSGLSELCQWQSLWKEYSKRVVQIETLIGIWEIEVANARQLSDPREISAVLGKATETLLKSVDMAVVTEMETFFAAVPKAQAAQGSQK